MGGVIIQTDSNLHLHKKKTRRRRRVTILMLLILVAMTHFYHELLNANKRITSATLDMLFQEAVDNANPAAPETITIAYAVSLIMCGDLNHDKPIGGFIDAATVLKHSIHKMHERSKYGYKTYVIVHEQATTCYQPLESRGYEPIIVKHPVRADEIRGEFLRNNIENEYCCGSAEFVKLHAFNITQHPVVVLLDMDMLMLQPMDELFDSMLLDPLSEDGARARAAVHREAEPFVWQEKGQPMPDKIDAFFTRDYASSFPGKVPCFQAGLLVLRPSEEAFLELLDIIREGNYTGDVHPVNEGWGGKGYGFSIGCKTVQGVVPYFYDVFHPRTAVELDGCIYNHMSLNVKYEKGGFHFARIKLRSFQKFRGQCRNGRGYNCTDCRATDISQIKSVHFTMCGKPWSCDPGVPTSNQINTTKCVEFQKLWVDYRLDYERELGTHPPVHRGNFNNETYRNGTFQTRIYRGICKNFGGSSNYIPIAREINQDWSSMQQSLFDPS